MSICLNMIVKNESKNMPTCLESVKDVVDYYIINDNGSTDGTPELIKEIMDGYNIKGEVYSSEWVNFGHNREEALQKVYQDGRWDYALIIDADGTLHHTNGAFNNLTADLYMVNIHFGNIEYDLPFLISTKKEFHWKGPVHNYIVGNGSQDVLRDTYVVYRSGAGAKSHGVTSEEKFLRDANLLEKELEKNPADTRSMFYLAQSYRDAGQPVKAYKYYMKRVQIGGWAEEVFMSMYSGANCKWVVEKVFPLDDYLAAYDYRPTRAEPLFKIAEYYRKSKMFNLGYLFGKTAMEIPFPQDKLFIDVSIYKWRIADGLSICCYWLCKYHESSELCNRLLSSEVLPEHEIARVKKNLEFSLRKVGNELPAR